MQLPKCDSDHSGWTHQNDKLLVHWPLSASINALILYTSKSLPSAPPQNTQTFLRLIVSHIKWPGWLLLQAPPSMHIHLVHHHTLLSWPAYSCRSLPHLLIPDSNQRQVAKKGYKRNTRLWQTPFPAPKPETMQRGWSRREVTVISQNIPLFFHWGKWGLPCSSPYCIEGLRDGGWETDPSRPCTFNPARNINTLWTFGTISLSDGHPNRAHSCHPGTNSL